MLDSQKWLDAFFDKSVIIYALFGEYKGESLVKIYAAAHLFLMYAFNLDWRYGTRLNDFYF